MAVTDPRSTLGAPLLPPVTVGREAAGYHPRPAPVLVGKRMRLFGFLLTLPLLYLLVSYGKVEGKLPVQPGSGAAGAARGRVLASDGSVLAGSISQPKAMPWDVTPRSYPLASLAGQVVGFANNDGGLDGIEHFLNARLAGGQDVRLTIDPSFQAAAEAALEKAVIEKKGKHGTAVAIEVGTGRVLAVANYPRFNPSRWQEYDPGTRGNRAFQALYEPGSTIKALVAAALINEGAARPTTRIETLMWRQVPGKVIRDAVKHPETLDLSGILRYSSNVGISILAERIGPEKLHHYLSAYGFGQAPEVEGAYTAKGIVHDWRTWRPTTFANASFGQGFASSTLQLAAAFSVLANDGVMVPPRIVEGAASGKARRVLSASAAQETRVMLRDAIEEGLKHQTIAGYCFGGKTGTAQVVVNGRYSHEVYDAVFAGFFPCAKPRVAMAVQVHAPSGSQYHGSQVALPAFRQIAQEVLAHWGVTPDMPLPEKEGGR
ncbi:MAG TPA: penicillin-binding protein 2 [Deinococcales bacterium]|nr:penicillin-binding protein 2 [Deinococcales bacterium]